MSSKLQDKLLQYSPEPPPGVWDEISATLDPTNQNSFADKLYQYQQNPDSEVWGKIEHQLDVPKSAKVIPFYQRYRRAIRYTGATAALVFLGVVTTLLISKKTVSEVPTETVVNNAQTSIKTTTNSSSPNSEGKIDYSAIAQSIPEETTKPHEKGLRRLISKLKPEQISTSVASPISFLFPDNVQRNEEITITDPSDRYMVYSDGDGNAMRLPKKIFDAIACPLNDIPCKQRIKQLQQKMASTDFTPDFTGIIELLSNLKENQ